MRTKILIIATLLTSSIVFAQNTTAEAFSKSYSFEAKKEYKKAISTLLTIKENYPVDLRLGWLYYLDGAFNKSKIYYKKAIGFKQKSIEARFGLVYPISAMQNWDEVIKVYDEILKINANENTVNYRLAIIYYTRKNWDKAEYYLYKILETYPFDYDTNLLLGNTFIKNGKIKEAKKVLELALLYNPQSKDVLTLLKGLQV